MALLTRFGVWAGQVAAASARIRNQQVQRGMLVLRIVSPAIIPCRGARRSGDRRRDEKSEKEIHWRDCRKKGQGVAAYPRPFGVILKAAIKRSSLRQSLFGLSVFLFGLPPASLSVAFRFGPASGWPQCA